MPTPSGEIDRIATGMRTSSGSLRPRCGRRKSRAACLSISTRGYRRFAAVAAIDPFSTARSGRSMTNASATLLTRRGLEDRRWLDARLADPHAGRHGTYLGPDVDEWPPARRRGDQGPGLPPGRRPGAA